jgi:hypothetical protein
MCNHGVMRTMQRLMKWEDLEEFMHGMIVDDGHTIDSMLWEARSEYRKVYMRCLIGINCGRDLHRKHELRPGLVKVLAFFLLSDVRFQSLIHIKESLNLDEPTQVPVVWKCSDPLMWLTNSSSRCLERHWRTI